MFFRLLALFVLVPVVELALLIRLGEVIGLWPTLGIIVFTGVVGSALAKQQGFSTLRRLQDRTQRGELPGTELLDGVIILVAGALLLTPGVLTDVVGFLGLIPFTRRLIRKFAIRQFKKRETTRLRFFWGGQSAEWSSSDDAQPADGTEDTTYEIIDDSSNNGRNE